MKHLKRPEICLKSESVKYKNIFKTLVTISCTNITANMQRKFIRKKMLNQANAYQNTQLLGAISSEGSESEWKYS